MEALEIERAASPLRDAGGNDPKNKRLPGALASTNSTDCGWVTLGDAAASVVDDLRARRAAWLCAHHGVPPELAAAIATTAFETKEARFG